MSPLTGMTAVVLYTFAGIVYDLCLASLFFIITMQIKESGISIAVSTLYVAVMNGNPFRNFLVLLSVPVIVLCVGILFFKRRDL